MNSSHWLSFFVEAGIPSPSAKKYAAAFEDNRMTKEMLLDLDKDILREIGITVMGDIIAILKHAKKAHQLEIKTQDKEALASNKKSAVAVAPMNVVPVVTPLTINNEGSREKGVWQHKTTPTPKSDPPNDVQYTTATYQKKLAQQDSVGVASEQHGTLHSDRIKIEEPVKNRTGDAQSFSSSEPMVLEEYTTATYEARLKMKRTAPQPASAAKVIKSQPSSDKTTRVIVLPSEERKSDNPVARSRRLLEAAGCYGAATEEPFVPSAVPRQSVFSRLEIPINRAQSNTERASNVKSRLGIKKVSPPLSSPPANKYSKLYSEHETTNVHSRLGPKKSLQSEEDTQPDFVPSMVADCISKHSDVHARLKKQGITVATPKGPLGKRLGKHAVFQRLE